MGLDDAILVKENHVTIAGGLGEAVRRAAAAHPRRPVEVECRDLDEVTEALEAGAARLLLDNMDAGQLRRAVELRDGADGEASLEASGGIGLENVAEVAATGVDFISIGALTHSAPALDLSMLLDRQPPDRVDP
jgi:nicotinate-nucleotide pyrophosphorylase (carboxylating)